MIETDRLILRRFRNSDFDTYAAIVADPEVMRFIAPPPDREGAHRSFCAILGHWHVRGYGMWAVEERATGAMIGHAGILSWEGRVGPEIGYALARSSWGKGYGTEVAAASLRHAHHDLGLRGLVAVIEPGNTGSEHVVQKLGARRDRIEHMRGKDLAIWFFPDPA